MKVIDLIKNSPTTAFSFEVLPPLKGNSIEKVFNTIDTLREFDPKYINITTHRSEFLYKDMEGGLYKRVTVRTRPGTVAVAAAIQNKYQIPAVPHIICSGFTQSETEYALIDLSFLGICDLLILRGDTAKHETRFIPTPEGHAHAIDLQAQVNRFNEGYFLDGSKMSLINTPFSYGVAGYPEKHDEAPNPDSDLFWLKEKVKAGADIEGIKQEMLDNLNMNKWICVSAEKLYITSYNNIIFAVMSDEDWAKPVYEGFKKYVNNKNGKELEKTAEEDIELPDEMLIVE